MSAPRRDPDELVEPELGQAPFDEEEMDEQLEEEEEEEDFDDDQVQDDQFGKHPILNPAQDWSQCLADS